MPQKRISPRDGGRWLSLVALAALISSILVITGGASQGAGPDDLSAAVDPPSLVLADSAAKPGAVPDADGPDRLVVELVADDSTIDAVAGSVVRSGGVVLGVSPETLLVEIGTAEVRRLTASGSPIEVRPPSRVDLIPAVQAPTAPDTTRAELTQVTNASAWHDAGLEGEGVAVGIVDYFRGSAWSAAEGAGSVPTPAGTFCRVGGVTCDIWSASSEHGVGVAEMVHAMAPRASVYLATVRTVTDLAAAVEWFDSQGVDIITRSLGAVMDGAGDGTGPLDSVVDDAVGRGMAWFNSAGNHAHSSGSFNGGYWRGTMTDLDDDQWMEFAPGDEGLGFTCGGLIQGFRWSDWAGDATDYDIYITDATGSTVLYSSLRAQGSGASPLEVIDAPTFDCGTYPVLVLFVRLFDAGGGTNGDVFEFMGNGIQFEYSQNPYSAVQPASDSANPGAASIGAVDPAEGTAIASYSSQGPTNDERVKPDLSAPSCIDSVAYAPSCFNGTSAATPVTAGAAALVQGAGVASTPDGTIAYLRQHAIDRGQAGADNVFGAGQLRLPQPPGTPNDPPTSISVEVDGKAYVGEPATVEVGFADLDDPDGHRLRIEWGDGSDDFDAMLGPGQRSATAKHTYGTAGTFEIRATVTDAGGGSASTSLILAVADRPEVKRIDEVGSADVTSGQWTIRTGSSPGSTNAPGPGYVEFYFGDPGDSPIFGDWDCDGVDTPGLYRRTDGFVYLRNSNSQGVADIRFFFGNPEDIPLAGDFDGDGCDSVSIYRPSEARIFIINELGSNDGGLGAADYSFYFGDTGDKPFVGDFDGDGIDTVGLHRETTGLVYYRDSNDTGIADNSFVFGDPGDRIFAGDWTGDGKDSPGVYRASNGFIYLKHTNTSGPADQSYAYPVVGDHWPVAGYPRAD